MAEEKNPSNETKKKKKSRLFFIIRVSILLSILFLVALYAIRDVRSRRARNQWERTLDVVVVLVHVEGTARVDADAIAAIRDRTDALEARLQAEATRNEWIGMGGSVPKPFRIKVLGPVDAKSAPPTPPSNSPVDLAKQAVDLKQWLNEIEPRAGVVPDHWDTRIFVTARKPASQARSMVEGQSEENGRIGIVDVELAVDMVDLTLFVVTHELLHTLGATDKYDPASGKTRVPDGIAEPHRVPLYPQRFAEVMARNIPITATREVIPESIDELAIGSLTAKEIGWTK